MKTVAVMAFLCSAAVAQAQTAPKWAGNYFCKASNSGGIAYEQTQRSWGGTSFRTNSQFVLSLKEAEKANQIDGVKSYDGETPGQYVVTISEMGKTDSKPRQCRTPGGTWGDKTPIMIYDWGFFQCDNALSIFKMNLGSMRYLNAYLQGFIDGKDNNENTPYIEIGTCARID